MKDTYEMCRLCLAKDQVNVDIFEGKGNEEQLPLKISTCLPIQISRGDQFPKKICGICSDKVNVMFLFWNTSVISELKLLEWSQQNYKNRKNSKIKNSKNSDRNDKEVEDLLGSKGYKKRVSRSDAQTKNKSLKNREESCSIITIKDNDASAATSRVTSPNDSVTSQIAPSSKETVHAVESMEIVEEESCSSIPDTQELAPDLLVQEEVCIEEVGDTVEWNAVSEEEVGHSTPDTQDLQQDLLVQEEVSTEEVDNVVEIVEEESATTTTDTQELEHDFIAQEEVSIEELGDTVEWSEVVEEESGNNTAGHELQCDHLTQEGVSIEKFSDLTELEVVSSNTVEEVRSSSTVGFQNDALEDYVAQELEIANEQTVYASNEKMEEETGVSTTDTQDLQAQEEVSIEEVPHLTTLEIISNDTGDTGFQEDFLIQDLEISHEEIVPAVELGKPIKKRFWKITNVTRRVPVEELKNTTCIVPTCDGNKNNTRKVFHPLPADDEIRKLWLELISRPDLLKKPYHDLQQERVCGAHFEPSQYYNKSKVKRYHCIVPNCDGRTNNARQTWHALPKDKELRLKWLAVLNRPDLLGIEDYFNYKVCSGHFAPSQYRCLTSDFLNARSIPLPIQDVREPVKPPTTNGTMLPPETPSKPPISRQERPINRQERPISRQDRPISRQKRPISRQKRRRLGERETVKLPTTNKTMLPPVTPSKRPISRQKLRRRDERKPVKLPTKDVAMLPPVTAPKRPLSRQKRRRRGEREPVKPPTTNSTMLPLVTSSKRPISRQKRRRRGEREPVKPPTTNDNMLPVVILSKRPISRQMRRRPGEREPVKPPTKNSAMLPLVVLSKRPMSRQKRRLRGEREPVKPPTKNDTMLPRVVLPNRPISRQKRRLRGEKEPVKPPTTNSAMLPPVIPPKRPVSRQKRKCRELSSQSAPKVTKVYSPRKKRKIDEQ